MTGHKVITIGRQFGSGGREIGQRLSEKLISRFMITVLSVWRQSSWE